MDKYIILIIIIVSAGSFGGLVKFFNSIDTTKRINWKDFLRYILTGIGAAILIPLFLNMISSDLLKTEKIEILNYFLFSGFCFIAAYLSDRFLSTIGDKILNEVQNVKNNQESTNETLDMLIENESEPSDSSVGDTPIKIDKAFQNITDKIDQKDKEFPYEILKSFDGNGQYKFRSIKGISKELGYPENIISIAIKTFEDNGLIRKVRKRDTGQFFWGITNLGKFVKSNKK